MLIPNDDSTASSSSQAEQQAEQRGLQLENSRPTMPHHNANNNNGNDSDDEDADEKFAIVPPKRAAKMKFPPGCHVLVTSDATVKSEHDGTGEPVLFLQGQVLQVVIEYETKLDLFKIQLTNGNVVLAQADALQFFVGTPVWYLPDHETTTATTTKVPAMVLGCDQVPPEYRTAMAAESLGAAPPAIFYSIQTLTSASKIVHGVWPETLAYRVVDATEAAAANRGEPVAALGADGAVNENINNNDECHRRRVSVLSSDDMAASSSSPLASIGSNNTRFNGNGNGLTKTNSNAGSACSGTETMVVSNQLHQPKGSNGSSNPPQQQPQPSSLPSPPIPGLGCSNSSVASSLTSPSLSARDQQPGLLHNDHFHNNADLLEYILVNTKRHDIKTALSAVTRDRRARGWPPVPAVGPVIVRTCLYWHLNGQCVDHCNRRYDHVPLTRERALELERELTPAMSPSGPIYCRPIPAPPQLLGPPPPPPGRRTSRAGEERYDYGGAGGSIGDRYGSHHRGEGGSHYDDRNYRGGYDDRQLSGSRSGGYYDDRDKRPREEDRYHGQDYYGQDKRSRPDNDHDSNQRGASRHSAQRPHESGMAPGPPPGHYFSPPPVAVSAPPKLPYHARPSVPLRESEEELFVVISMTLPTYFGKEFLINAIMGENGLLGRDLCDKYSCIMDWEGTLITDDADRTARYQGRDFLCLNIRGASVPLLFQCRAAIEGILFHAVPRELRGYLLTTLAWLNNYHQRSDDIIQACNPYAEHFSSEEDLMYMTSVKGSSIKDADKDKQIVNLNRVKDWKEALEQEFPECSIEVNESDDLRNHNFPDIYGQVVLWGPKLDQVQNLRTQLFAWAFWSGETK